MMNKQEDTLVNVMNAIRSYLRLATYHEPDKQMEAWLNKYNFSKLQIVLIDGMGIYQLVDACQEDGFLRRHLMKKVNSVYPPTTVAATTALLSGKYPMETAWLGWQQYFKEIDQHLIMFLNREYYQKAAYPTAYTYETLPYRSMIDEAVEKGMDAKEIFPAFRENGVASFSQLCERLKSESMKTGQSLCYGYWDALDDTMHHEGATSNKSRRLLQDYEKDIASLCHALSNDTGLILLADHGQIDVTSICLKDYPALLECMDVLPSLEGRTVSFHIKKAYLTRFKECFLKEFGDDFILYTKAEAIEKGIFGHGCEHPRFRDFLGDYIACAKTNKSMIYDLSYRVKGNHSGMSKSEMEIPIILYPYESSK